MHLMIDVETLGTRPGSVVWQIGVVAFDIDMHGNLDQGIELKLNPQEQIDLGFKVDWSTIRWWMEQSREAQAAMPKVGLPLEIALAFVRDYVEHWGPVEGVWGNGPDFDLTAMTMLFQAADMKVPWAYNAGRDVRTMKEVVNGLGLETVRVKPLIAHSALSDARAQALWVQEMWGSLPGRSANGSPTAAAEGT